MEIYESSNWRSLGVDLSIREVELRISEEKESRPLTFSISESHDPLRVLSQDMSIFVVSV
jgi:hypothetical protein